MKNVLLILLTYSTYVGAVNFPDEQEKRGLKRYVEEMSPQQTHDDMLIEAAQIGDLLTVQQLLAQTGYSINRRYEGGKTLLMHAAGTGQSNLVDYLIGAGANANLQDESGNTALHYATQEDHVAVVLRLLQIDNLQLNLRNNLGNTPLISAISSNSAGVVNILLTPVNKERGLDINAANNERFSPIALAIIANNVPLLNRLLQLRADVGFILPDATALQYAVAHEQDPIIELLLQIPSLDANQTNPKGETALMVAALVGNLNMARQLIAKGARVALKDKDGATALDFAKASESSQKKAMIRLLEQAKKTQRR